MVALASGKTRSIHAPRCQHRVSFVVNKDKTAETRGAMAAYGWTTGVSGYDPEDRLTAWTRTDSNLSQSWTLTLEGDWQQFTENTATQTRTHGPAHELTAVDSSVLAYDPKGNLTVDNTKGHTYTWDFDNRLQSADTDGDQVADVSFEYDALGRRVSKTAGTTSTVYVPAGWQGVCEYPSGTAPSSPTEKYAYGSYIDEPIIKVGTGGTVYYHANDLYWVSALTDTNGVAVERYRYTPYGVITILAPDGTTVRQSSSYANAYTYTGRRWDPEEDLYYYRARYYDPLLGRFVGRDPIAYKGGPTLYRALFPTHGLDPFGLKCKLPTLVLKKTLDVDVTDRRGREEKEEEIDRQALQALPIEAHDGSIKEPVEAPPMAAGSSRFYIAHRFRSKLHIEPNGKCCCDFSGSQFTFLAVAAVVRADTGVSRPDRVYFGLDEDGAAIVYEAPGDTLEHEHWHTDGAKFPYATIDNRLKRHVTKKLGFNSGAQEAFMKLHSCLSTVRRMATPQSTYEDCDRLGRKCVSEYLTSRKARDRITYHGRWHIKFPNATYDYSYNETLPDISDYDPKDD